jgi:tRNA(Arg) A34 adenosine deaminase TadA
MCLGAAAMAHVRHIVYALHDENTQSRLMVANTPYIRQRIDSFYGGVLEAEARALFARFDPEALEYIVTGIPPLLRCPETLQ